MPTPTKGPRLGGGPAHERLMLANLAAALFTHKSIKTTETKAKRLRPVAERLITFAKKGDLHNRRRALAIIGDKTVIHELFTEIAPLVENREGGYTRITKLGFRKGDNASMVQIELVLEPVNPKPKRRPEPVEGSAKKTAESPAQSTTPATEATDVDPETEGDLAEDATPEVTEDEAAEAVAVAEDAPVEEAPVEEVPAEESADDAPPVDDAATEGAATDDAATDDPDKK